MRGILRNRIIERLDQLDDETLQELDARLTNDDFGLRPADPGERDPRLLSRRQLLAGLLGGGAALGGTNLATAWYAREQGKAVGWQLGANATRTTMAAEASRTQQEMAAEIDALRGLVSHYEALERVDLDRAVARSIERFESSMAGLPGVSGALASGINGARSALDRFEAALPAIREGMAHVDDVLDSLDQRLESLREVLADTVERAEPIADRLGRIFDAILDRLPFGVGERIELVLLRLRQVMEAVPATMAAVREHLLSPLRLTWFAEAAEDDVQAGLLTPIRTQVLDPAEQLLTDLDDVAAEWQREVAEPVQRALAERRAIRQALAEYKQRHGLI